MLISFLKRHIGSLVALVPASGILLGLLVPIYVDEVAWRFLERSTIDGGVDRSISEGCGPTVQLAPPFFMEPVRFISNHINLALADPIFVRLTGVVGALVWLVLLWTLIATVARTPRERRAMALLAFAMVSTGVLPFMLALSRPEEPILLTLTIALIVTLWRWGRGWGKKPKPDTFWHAWGAVTIIVVMAAIAISFHMKGVVYAPIFVLCALVSTRGPAGRWARWIGAGSIVILTLVAIPYWIDRFKCPDDPSLVAMVAKQNLAAVIFGGGSVMEKLWIGVSGANPLNYVRLIEPARTYMSQWLTPNVLSLDAVDPWRRVTYFCWTMAFGLAAFSLIIAGAGFIKKRTFDARVLLPVALGGTVIVWGAMQFVKNAYEAGLVLPVCAIAIVLGVRAACYDDATMRWIERIGAVFAALAFVNMALLCVSYAPPLWAASRQSGYLATQPYSISAYGFGPLREKITATGRMCGITTDKKMHGLLIDDATYFPYMATNRPLHWTGILSQWNGNITDPAAFLRKKNSSGVILGCSYLPPAMRARAKRNGQFCCLSGDDLKAM